MAVPKNLPKAKVNVEEFITKDGKLDSNKFWKLSDAQIANLVGDAVHDLRTYIVHPSTHKKAASSIRLLEALDKENPDLGLSNYVTLFKGIENGSTITKSYLDGLKQYDPDTFNLYLKYPGWEAYSMPDYDFSTYRAENTPKDVESNTGAFTGNPVDTVSPTETSSGVLTSPPAKLPEKSTPVNIDNNAKELPISKDESKIKPKDEVTEIPKLPPPPAEKPIASPSPETISEAMRDAAISQVGDTKLNKEDIPAFLAKEEGRVKTTEGTAKETETKAPVSEEAKTEAEGALTSKDKKSAEPSEGMFKKIGSWMFNHPKISIGTTLGLLGGIGISQADKIAEALKAGKSPSRNIGEKPVTSSNVNYRVWENYNPDYLNEGYTPGKIPSQIPQDNLTSVKESTASKKVKNQPQVVNTPAPENNATADYVRAAYNSYIPSDAGRAYQKAIYGDPLELDRMRLQQQQQQKWRDFVMRSGQSPAELVQRGLMPYDALQYV